MALRTQTYEVDIADVEYLRHGLEGAGYHVQYAINSKQGLSMATRCNPMAILLDIVMPGEDGPKIYEVVAGPVSER